MNVLFPDAERCQWFEEHARQVIARCHRVVEPGAQHVWLPGGDGKYGSFFPRDFVMQCRSGFIPAPAMEAALKLILLHQSGPAQRELANGLHVNPWTIPDHINLPGLRDAATEGAGGVFFPGTNSPGNDQGTGRYGTRATDDNVYEVIELTRLVTRGTTVPAVQPDPTAHKRDACATLRTEINGVTIFDRLDRAFRAAIVHPETGLCWNRPGDWAAANFHDGIGSIGFISLTSILRFRAAQTMREFCRLLGDENGAAEYERVANRISTSVVAHLVLPSGWLMAGTEVNRQADVWSTGMAVYYGVLQGEPRRRACEALRAGHFSRYGYLRHLPAAADAIPGQQMWEDNLNQGYGTYQNGGYWPTPLGYVVVAIAEVDREAARQLAAEFIDHTRRRAEAGAPFEWINPDLGREDGKWYGPSAALPLEAFRRLSHPLCSPSVPVAYPVAVQ